jgi:hypothetical protein
MVAGGILVAASGIVLDRWGLVFTVSGHLIVGGFFGAMGAASMILLWQRELRLVEDGIRRRRFTGWELWPWETFAGANIARGVSPDYYVDQSDPASVRRLPLSCLSQEDQEYVHQRIAEVWRPAPAPALPLDVCVRFWNIKYQTKSTAKFSDEGISLEHKRTRNRVLYKWADVRQVTILRTNHEHLDFKFLQIEFADGERIRLHRNGKREWTGPEAETVVGYVQAHVSPDRITIRASIGPTRSIDEAGHRIGIADREVVLAKWLGRGPVAVAVFVSGAEIYTVGMKHGWNPVQWDGATQLACAVFVAGVNSIGFLLWLACQYVYRNIERQRQALIETRDELQRRGSVA